MIKIRMNSVVYYLFVFFVATILGAYHLVVRDEELAMAWSLATRFSLFWVNVISIASLSCAIMMRTCLYFLQLDRHAAEVREFDMEGDYLISETEIRILPGMVGIVFLAEGARLLSIAGVVSGKYVLFFWGLAFLFLGLILPKITISTAFAQE